MALYAEEPFEQSAEACVITNVEFGGLRFDRARERHPSDAVRRCLSIRRRDRRIAGAQRDRVDVEPAAMQEEAVGRGVEANGDAGAPAECLALRQDLEVELIRRRGDAGRQLYLRRRGFVRRR